MLGLRLALIAACWLQLSPSSQTPDAGNAEERVPFHIGERLTYTIKWDPPWFLFFLPAMEAGEAEILLAGETEYQNGKALKIAFKAHSSGALTKMAGMKVDDEYVFLTEPGTFCTLAVSGKIREGKRRRQIDVQYLRDSGRLHFRELDESTNPPKLKRDDTKSRIPPCVHDPLSALYFYRTSPLQIGRVQMLTIGDNDKVKEIRASVEKQEPISAPAGKFSAWKISTTALMGNLFKESGQFKLWLSADDRKAPVQFEVNTRLGRVLGKLKSQQ